MAEIGDIMKDGTIYAGISPDTGKPFYAAPADAPKLKMFFNAVRYTKKLVIGGKNDFRLPSKAELEVLYANKDKGALKGTFNTSGTLFRGWYWTAEPNSPITAPARRFADGARFTFTKVHSASVRCVR